MSRDVGISVYRSGAGSQTIIARRGGGWRKEGGGWRMEDGRRRADDQRLVVLLVQKVGALSIMLLSIAPIRCHALSAWAKSELAM
jgi:hypothetical protein